MLVSAIINHSLAILVHVYNMQETVNLYKLAKMINTNYNFFHKGNCMALCVSKHYWRS